MSRHVLRRASLACLAGSIACTAGAFAQTSAAGGERRVTEAMVNEALELSHCELVRIVVPAPYDAAMTVAVPFEGQELRLELHPHSVRAPGYQVVAREAGGVARNVEPGPVLTKRGTVAGLAGSRVAAAATERGFEALILLTGGAGRIVIEPLAEVFPGAGADLHAVYRDGWKDCSSLKACGVTGDAQVIDWGGGGAAQKAACGGDYEAELATEADYEYYVLKGSVANVESAINTVINATNLQYEEEVDITHSITFMNVWSTSSDPYSNTTDSGTALSEFRSYWNANMGAVQRDVAEMFTNKSWDGSVIGIAYLNGICNTNAYDVVRHISGSSCRSDLSAHELGHNWSAGHCSCPSTTMNPSLTCANTFASSSITSIVNYRNNKQACLGCQDICQTDLMDGGPGSGELSLCGGDLSTGTTATLALAGTGAAGQIGVIFYGPGYGITPFRGGSIKPFPFSIGTLFTLDGSGAWSVVVAGGGGPATVYLQAVYNDPAQSQGTGFSNTIMATVNP